MKLLIILVFTIIGLSANAQKTAKQSVKKNSNAKSLLVAGKINPTNKDKKTKAPTPISNKKESKEKANTSKKETNTKTNKVNTKKVETVKTKTETSKTKKTENKISKKETVKQKTNTNNTNKTTIATLNKSSKNVKAIAKKEATKETKKVTKKELISKSAIVAKNNKKDKIAKENLDKGIVKKEKIVKKPLIQKIKKVIPEIEVDKEVVHTKHQEKEAKFEMLYPTGFFNSEIKEHYGKIQIGSVVYPNESVSFLTPIEQEVECNLDSAVVTDVAIDDDGLYIVSLKRHHYTIVMANLNYVDVAVGNKLVQGDLIGTVSADNDYTNKGSMELMLLKDKTIINPEKHLVRKFSPKPIVTELATNTVIPEKPTVIAVEEVELIEAEKEL
jgi:hypothetical protein